MGPQKNAILPVTELKDRYGIVVLLDALGTKNRSNEDPKEYVKLFQSFVASVRQSFENNSEWLEKKFGNIMKDINFEIAAFSDTVFILGSFDPSAMTNDRENRDHILVSIAGKLISGVMADAISHGIFPRGCVSIGRFIKSDNPHFMILGQPVSEADEYYEMSEWSGISAAPSVHRVLSDRERKPGFHSREWNRYNLPVKNGIEVGAWVIRWPTYFRQGEQGLGPFANNGRTEKCDLRTI
jgi:hypothetical protein